MANTKVLEFNIVDRDGDTVGTLKVERDIYVSQPTAEGKGGGKNYLRAEASLDFGDKGMFGGRIVLWPPVERKAERKRQTAGTL